MSKFIDALEKFAVEVSNEYITDNGLTSISVKPCIYDSLLVDVRARSVYSNAHGSSGLVLHTLVGPVSVKKDLTEEINQLEKEKLDIERKLDFLKRMK